MNDKPAEKVGTWGPHEIRQAAAIWQRYFADVYGEKGPLGAQHRTFITIGQALNRSFDSVAKRYVAMGPSFSANPRGKGPSEQAVAERERRRAAMDRRDLTATFFDDPPPGYSALDKRRAGLAR